MTRCLPQPLTAALAFAATGENTPLNPPLEQCYKKKKPFNAPPAPTGAALSHRKSASQPLQDDDHDQHLQLPTHGLNKRPTQTTVITGYSPRTNALIPDKNVRFLPNEIRRKLKKIEEGENRPLQGGRPPQIARSN
jgi:hypothetical protein